MEENFIELGFISKTHGYNGALTFVMNSFKTDVIDSPQWFFVERYGEFVPYFVEKLTIVDDSVMIVKLRDVDDEKQAKSFVGSSFGLADNELSIGEETMVPIAVDKGWKVFFNEQFLGEVREVVDNNSQILLTVVGDGREYLIPYVNDFLIEYNGNEKFVILDLPDGLIDLQ